MSETENKAPSQTPPPKQKVKVKLTLTGAGSYRNGELFMRKNESCDFESTRADELLKTGLFTKS